MKPAAKVRALRAACTKSMVQHLAIAMLAMSILVLSSLSGQAELPAKIANGRVNLGPPTIKMDAGYFDITNTSGAPLEIVGADSRAYGAISLHQSQLVGGVATMEPVGRVVVAPGGTVSFKPGGLHLMLMKPQTKLRPGSVVPIELRLASGQTISIKLHAVTETKTSKHHGHHGHDATKHGAPKHGH